MKSDFVILDTNDNNHTYTWCIILYEYLLLCISYKKRVLAHFEFHSRTPVKFKMNFRVIGTRMCTQPLFQSLLLHAMMSSSRLVILNYAIAVVCWKGNLVYCVSEDLTSCHVIPLENLFKHVSWFLEIVMPRDQHQCCILLWRRCENNLRLVFKNILINNDHLY